MQTEKHKDLNVVRVGTISKNLYLFQMLGWTRYNLNIRKLEITVLARIYEKKSAHVTLYDINPRYSWKPSRAYQNLPDRIFQ